MNAIHSIIVPQLNVNDDAVTLVEWSVPHGAAVDAQMPVSVVETSKAANELCAERPGVLYHLITPVTKVKVGDEIGLIGPSLPAIEAFLRERASSAASAQSGTTRADAPLFTPRARLLMEQTGVSEHALLASGIRGAIKEKDVRAYLAAHAAPAEAPPAVQSFASMQPPLPECIRMLVDDAGPLSEHEAAVADVLSISRQSLLLTTAELELDLSAINPFLARARGHGQMLTLLHCIVSASAHALRKYPRMRSMYYRRSVYCYRECAVGFVVRSLGGTLTTPVIRQADALTVGEIARRCHALTMKINRGTVRQEELEGGCFTISHIAQPPLAAFQALPNRYQSAILAVAAERPGVQLLNGQCREVPLCTLTLSYDHALCDGMYAADFLHALVDELNRLSHE